MASKHKLGLSVLSNLPTGRELADIMEGMFARQYAKARTDQERVEIAAWVRSSRMNGNGRAKHG